MEVKKKGSLGIQGIGRPMMRDQNSITYHASRIIRITEIFLFIEDDMSASSAFE
jgi:hypothetical protein